MRLELGKTYKVKVLRIQKTGIIVEMQDFSTQFIHISKLGDEYIRDCRDVVRVGDIIHPTVIKGDRVGIELSLRKSDRGNYRPKKQNSNHKTQKQHRQSYIHDPKLAKLDEKQKYYAEQHQAYKARFKGGNKYGTM